MCTLRNLCMGSERSIQAVMDWGGADLLACLEKKLDLTRCGSGVEIFGGVWRWNQGRGTHVEAAGWEDAGGRSRAHPFVSFMHSC